MTKVMTTQDEMRNRLVRLLCNVHCKGEEDSRSCAARRAGTCRVIDRLDMCMINTLAEHLLAAGVLAPPVKEGQTVYAAIRMADPGDGDDGIDEWQVHGVMYKEGKWYAIDKNSDESVVGGVEFSLRVDNVVCNAYCERHYSEKIFPRKRGRSDENYKRSQTARDHV